MAVITEGGKILLASAYVSQVIDLALPYLQSYLCSLSFLRAFLTWVLHRGSAILAAQPVLDMEYIDFAFIGNNLFRVAGIDHS